MTEEQWAVAAGINACELRTALKSRQVAIDKLVAHNLRFVVSRVKLFCRKYHTVSLELLDLVSEGNIGLRRAAEKFDPERGCRFLTMASWWIHHAVYRAANERDLLIKVPEEKRAAFPSPLSLDSAIESGRDAAREDQLEIEDLNGQQPFDYVLVLERKEIVQQLLGRLNERERLVVEMSWGLTNGGEVKRKEIARVLGVSRERVRQINNEALSKLQAAAKVCQPNLANYASIK